MTDRRRHRDDDLEPEAMPGVVGGVGGEALIPMDSVVHHGPPPDGILEIEEDVESYEGDEELLNPGSPEFEHLTKPGRPPNE